MRERRDKTWQQNKQLSTQEQENVKVQKITGGGIKLISHIKTRNTLKDIPLVETFEALLNKSMISDEEKELIRLHYIQKKDFRFIGDTLGYSEASIKAKHRKILKKLNKLL